MPTIILKCGTPVLVSEEDYHWLRPEMKPYWALGTNGYARRSVGRGCAYMHRLVAERIHGAVGPKQVVDHINRNKLDNRRENLRVVTYAVNNRNQKVRAASSRFKGVNLHCQTGTWRAYVVHSGKQVHLGCFATEEEAAHAVNLAMDKMGWPGERNPVQPVALFPLIAGGKRSEHGVGIRQEKNGSFTFRVKKWGVEISRGGYTSSHAATEARQDYLARITEAEHSGY